MFGLRSRRPRRLGMPRTARLAMAGVPFHLTHRGNRGEAIFRDSADRTIYLSLLGLHSERHELEIWNFCLMSNHVHLVVWPRSIDSLRHALRGAHGSYAQRFNRRHGLTGHLWANRFYSCALGETHLFRAARYVELNPVRAGLCTNPLDYAWSSAVANISGRDHPPLSRSRPWLDDPGAWRRFLEEALGAGDEPELRKSTLAGRPLGSAVFIRWIECQRSGAHPSSAPPAT